MSVTVFPKAFFVTTFDKEMHDLKIPYKNANSADESEIVIPPNVKTKYAVNACVMLLVTTGLFCYVSLLTGTIGSIGDIVKNVVTGPSAIRNICVISGVALALIMGSAYVMHKSTRPQPVIHDSKKILQPGKFTGDDHWLPTFWKWHDKNGNELAFEGYLDRSNLTEKNGKYSGTAYVYERKRTYDHYRICASVALLSPLYAVAAVAWNLIQCVISPFYVVGAIAYEKIYDTKIDADQYFEYMDILKEPCKAIKRAVQSPFFATALLFCSFYAQIDHLNGRKLGSFVERHWNGVPRDEGIWPAGPYIGPKFKWIRGASTLSHWGFYGPGCWQPDLIVTIEDNQIIEVRQPSGRRTFQNGTLVQDKDGNWGITFDDREKVK